MTTRRLGTRLLILGWCLGIMTLGMARGANAQPITVTNTDDSGTGSLREAIANAMGGETIDFSGLTGCPCTIALTSGELVIDKNLTISGPGPNLLAVSGEGASRVFRIAPGVVAELQGLAVRNGNGLGGGSYIFGGGILNEGALTLLNTIIAQNSAPDLAGGGIYSSDQASLTVRNSVFTFNQASQGGAIYSDGSLLMSGSTLTSNAGRDGGGMRARSGTIVGSTIAGNTATFDGGGVAVRPGSLTLVNCTISGNSASRGAGVTVLGLGDRDTTLTLINTTVIANTATSGDGGGGLETEEATLVLNNTIVAGNSPQDIYADGPVFNNNSLIGVDAAAVLSPLADNGGPTQTHALVPGSLAIGAGDNALLPADSLDLDNDGNTTEPVPVDQRGVGFARVAGFRIDIGAVEAACSAITISPATLPNPSVGAAYSQTLTATGGEGITSFSATGLPPGLTMSSDGVLGGTATAAGTFSVTVTATDAGGCGSTHTYTLTIADPSCGIVIGPATLKTPYLATLYYQPLSVMPSGQYTVTVSAGALPQGVYLFAIGHHWLLGGIPSKPGEYTFTLAVKKKNSPCAPTRTFTVIVPATVLPQLTCVAKTGGKQYTARFGYDNSTDAAVTIPVGADNYFTPGAQGRGQATTFQKGRVTNAFSVVFKVSGNNADLALWYLRGPDGIRRPVNITTATSRCP